MPLVPEGRLPSAEVKTRDPPSRETHPSLWDLPQVSGRTCRATPFLDGHHPCAHKFWDRGSLLGAFFGLLSLSQDCNLACLLKLFSRCQCRSLGCSRTTSVALEKGRSGHLIVPFMSVSWLSIFGTRTTSTSRFPRLQELQMMPNRRH